MQSIIAESIKKNIKTSQEAHCHLCQDYTKNWNLKITLQKRYDGECDSFWLKSMMLGVKLFPQKSQSWLLVSLHKKDCTALFVVTKKHNIRTDKTVFTAGCNVTKEPILVSILFEKSIFSLNNILHTWKPIPKKERT